MKTRVLALGVHDGKAKGINVSIFPEIQEKSEAKYEAYSKPLLSFFASAMASYG